MAASARKHSDSKLEHLGALDRWRKGQDEMDGHVAGIAVLEQSG